MELDQILNDMEEENSLEETFKESIIKELIC